MADSIDNNSLADLVLSAFADGRAQDRTTIATGCFGASPGTMEPTLFRANLIVADHALATLESRRLIVKDSLGWYRSSVAEQIDPSNPGDRQ